MAYFDLREFMGALESAGEFQRVTNQIDPHLEAGAIAQRLAERGGPAVHFSNVKGASNGVTMAAGLVGRGMKGLWSKVAIALEIDPQSDYHTVLEEVLRRRESPIRPLQVDGGLCKEVKVDGASVDLGALAAPYLHDGDGGNYLTTWAITMAQEPGGGYLAWDVLPLMVSSKNTLTGHFNRDSAVGGIWHDSYASEGKEMPFAIALGTVPTATMAAAFQTRRGSTTKAEIAGSLQREPMQMVKSELSDLLVPAAAEMILEGVVVPGKTADTGPFPGTFGYVAGGMTEGTVFKVKTITHRKDPILPFSAWGTPTCDLHIARGLDADAQLKAAFEAQGAPVVGIFTPPWLAGSVVAATTKVPYTAYAQAVAGVVRNTEATKYTPYILVCNDDIDITNPVSLFHAMVTKCHPERDTWIIKNSEAAADAPYLTAEERKLGKGAAAIFDCTWPLDWDRSIAVPPKVDFANSYPENIKEKVLAEWSAGLGFPKETDRPA